MTTGQKVAIGAIGLTLWSILIALGGYSLHTAATDAGQRLDLSAGMVLKTMPYETPLFSVEFPVGGQVRVENISGKSKEGAWRKSTRYHDDAGDGSWSAVLGYADYPTARDLSDNPLATSGGDVFRPGYREGPVADTTLGGLPAGEIVARGMLKNNGIPATLHMRVALSPDRLRTWTLVTVSDNRTNQFSEADAEEFFDSFKIK